MKIVNGKFGEKIIEVSLLVCPSTLMCNTQIVFFEIQ